MATKRKAPAKKKPTKRVAAKTPKRCTAKGPAQAAQKGKAEAASLYKRFHGEEPESFELVNLKTASSGVLLGDLEGVIYRTPDGTRYLHEFRASAAPSLVASSDGRQLFVQGGRYRFTARGIVDQRKRR